MPYVTKLIFIVGLPDCIVMIYVLLVDTLSIVYVYILDILQYRNCIYTLLTWSLWNYCIHCLSRKRGEVGRGEQGEGGGGREKGWLAKGGSDRQREKKRERERDLFLAGLHNSVV